MDKDEVIRKGIRLIKYKFLRWKQPEVELPADHVIEECVAEIYEMSKEKQGPIV